MANRRKPDLRSRLPRVASPAELSRRLLELRGQSVVTRVEAGAGLDLMAIDPRRLRPVLVAAVAPAGRFPALVRLLGDAKLAALCRDGCRLEVHTWTRRPDGAHLGEIIELRPDDFAAGDAGGVRPGKEDHGQAKEAAHE